MRGLRLCTGHLTGSECAVNEDISTESRERCWIMYEASLDACCAGLHHGALFLPVWLGQAQKHQAKALAACSNKVESGTFTARHGFWHTHTQDLWHFCFETLPANTHTLSPKQRRHPQNTHMLIHGTHLILTLTPHTCEEVKMCVRTLLWCVLLWSQYTVDWLATGAVCFK